MKQYQIEYNGQTGPVISADHIKYDRRNGVTLFYVRQSQRLVAIIPAGYLIVQLPQQPIKEQEHDS
jgi:hypothetical protein